MLSAGINPSYIDSDQWQTEVANFLPVLYTGLITEPTSINKLVTELIQQATLILWWDWKALKLKLQVVRGVVTDALTVNKSNYISGSFSIQEQPDKRVTQIWTYYAKYNPLLTDDKPENFRSCAVTIDATRESEYGTPAIRKMYCRWIPTNARNTALRVNDVIMGRYAVQPRLFSWSMLNRGNSLLELAMGLTLSSDALQQDTGEPDIIPAQMTRWSPGPEIHRFEAEEMRFTVSSTFGGRSVVIESDQLNINARDAFNDLYPPPVSGDDILILVEAGVVVGSASASLPALDIGLWPAGVTVRLRNKGRIQGTGGAGGGGQTTSKPNEDGKPGGVALYSRNNFILEGDGEIWSGGGGGAGAGYTALPGGGGGGGQGTVGGKGSGQGANAADGTSEAPGQGGKQGTGTRGATGGAKGQPGGDKDGKSGGAAGAGIDGNSYITSETGTNDVQGSRIN